ncbi:MerR family transcriptional regulator [Actinokineospora iranica]|uniref:DNA-binding transcriptional regulator, MerR family n=1 Tax=Actinokineospora iranica TaxID=1271860 RepID=A0A1G6Q4B1_9PSEU|nr:MerR family transcriptional regulator [Actinokineospora iranica]SDC87300.1 DNA-binding transcriptional regulator, MerR family [Actinokineospora iranica]
MRIGDAAAAAGLTPRALRYYEHRGLVAPRRAVSGHREYRTEDVRRLIAVRELLEAGLTIGDVVAFAHVLDLRFPPDGEAAKSPRDHLGGCPVAEVAQQRLADLDRRIERLTALRARLADALRHRFGELLSGDQVA